MDMDAAIVTTKAVEQFKVSPPPTAVSTTVLPTTFFDAFMIFIGAVKRLFFYQSPGITINDFTTFHVPAFRHSLSLTLRHFFSLAGNLLLSDMTIVYTDGDSVPLIVAESDADFAKLMADEPKDVKLAHPFVPQLPPADESGRVPLLAVQFTVFPGAGFTLGVAIHHGAADGSSSARFLKSWAAIHSSRGDPSAVVEPPIYNRGALLELNEDKAELVNDLQDLASKAEMEKASSNNQELGKTARATFNLTRASIDKLRLRIASVTGERPSTFVAAVSYVWVCLTKARGHSTRTVYLGFVADCRTRIDPPLPLAYFGNCLGSVNCEASGSELAGEDGLVVAAKLLQEGIRLLEGRAVVSTVREMIRKVATMESFEDIRILSIAGSPRLGVYGVDFGWGSPKKVEVISIEAGEAMSLAESRDGVDGGLEIGMVGPAAEIERFGLLFKTNLDGLL